MVKDVYFLTVHEPYAEPGAPGPVNGLIVHAATFLHPQLPQPDAGRMHRCLTEAPGRAPGALVPLALLDWELDGGRLWPQVGDWKTVTTALIDLSRSGTLFASMPLILTEATATLLSAPPGQAVHIITPDGVTVAGDRDRTEVIASLAAGLPEATGEPPLWPGDGLLPPPGDLPAMPYHPRRQRG